MIFEKNIIHWKLSKFLPIAIWCLSFDLIMFNNSQFSCGIFLIYYLLASNVDFSINFYYLLTEFDSN
jgi:hypothetical protein